jgi:hypothetical protein
MDPQQRDARLRRRIRWTAVVLALVALGFYLGTFIRQMQ